MAGSRLSVGDLEMRLTSWVLIRRSLRFRARSHFGVVLGAAIGSAALIGALVVGDSVRGSLRERALSRLGAVEFAMSTRDRFFRQELAEGLESKDLHTLVRSGPGWVRMAEFRSVRATALQLAATVARQDGAARVNQVNVLGIDLADWRQLADLGRAPTSADDLSTHAFFVVHGLSSQAE